MDTLQPLLDEFSTYDQRVKLLKALSEKQFHLLTYDCAFHVLYLFEHTVLDETLPRESVEMLLEVINGKVSKQQLRNKYESLHQLIRRMSGHYPPCVMNSLSTVFDAVGVQQEDMLVAPIFYAALAEDDWTNVTKLYQQTQPNVPFHKHYRTPDTIGLAREINETKDFGLMPLLADAIMDLGAENTDSIRKGKGLSNWALYHLAQCGTG